MKKFMYLEGEIGEKVCRDFKYYFTSLVFI